MAYLVKHNPDDKFSEDFRNILINQDLINADMYDDYSTEKMYQEVCNVLKKEKYIKEKSFLKSVNLFKPTANTLYQIQDGFKGNSLVLHHIRYF